jgi:hypothetical protein
MAQEGDVEGFLEALDLGEESTEDVAVDSLLGSSRSQLEVLG